MALVHTRHRGGAIPSISSREAIPPAMEVLQRWVLEREVPDAGLPISLNDQRPLWCDSAALSVDGRLKRRIKAGFADISYLMSACDLHWDVMLQKAILKRMLNDQPVKWLPQSRVWPISASGQEPFEFTAFTFYLCAAFHNLLCILSSFLTKQPRDYRRPVVEFLARARRRLKHQAQTPLTLGDLLAAYVILEAASDLGRDLKAAAGEACKRRTVEYVLVARWKQRVALVQKLCGWYESSFKKHLVGLNPILPFLDDRLAWNDQLAPVASSSLVSSAKWAPARRWLAWRLAARIRKGGDVSRGPLKMLASLSHNRQDGRACGFVAQTILEVITGVALQDAEGFFQRFRDKSGSSILAPMCGWTAFVASQVRAGRAADGDGVPSEVWVRFRRAISRLMWTAIRSGEFGQLFVGEFLHELVTSAGEDCSLAAISGGLPEMRVHRLCREWFRWSLNAELLESDNSNSYVMLLRVVRDTLCRQHPDMDRIFRGQQAAWNVTAKSGRRPLPGTVTQERGRGRAGSGRPLNTHNHRTQTGG